MVTTIRAFSVVFLLVLGAGAADAAEDPGGRTILVLDASGSMWGQIEGKAKIVIARGVVAKVVKSLDPKVELGLIAYGHRRKGDCGDIEVLIPVSPLDPKRIINAVNRLKPKGKTPLSEAVRRAARHLKYTEEKATVVLVSDGKETCNADPCALGRELEESGADFTVYVVGFDVSREERHGLQCLAENTGGVYLSADDAESLAAALGTAVKQAATGSPPSTVLVPVLVEGGERVHVGVKWTVSEARDEKGTPGDEVYSTVSDVVVTPLPTGRYVVEANYANAGGRKLIEIDAKDPGQHQVALNAGLLHLSALKKEGGDLYRGYPYLFWSVHPIGGDGKPARKYLVKDDGNRKEFILAPGLYRIRAEAGVIATETDVEIKAGETAERTVVLNSGTVNLTALVKEGGRPYKGYPYLFWSIHPFGADGRPAKKYLVKDDGNPKKFVLPPGRYVARAEAGVVKAETRFEVRADDVTEAIAIMASGTVNLTALVKEGGRPYKGSPYLFWSIHPVGPDGTPAKKYLVKDDGNPKTFVLSPGRYVARAEAGVVKAEARFEIKAGETTKNITVFEAGRARVAFVDGPGGKPLMGLGVWYVHPVGADGTPAKKYLTYADRNPYEFFLPRGRYVARGKIGEARFEGAFEVAPGDRKKVEIVAGQP